MLFRGPRYAVRLQPMRPTSNRGALLPIDAHLKSNAADVRENLAERSARAGNQGIMVAAAYHAAGASDRHRHGQQQQQQQWQQRQQHAQAAASHSISGNTQRLCSSTMPASCSLPSSYDHCDGRYLCFARGVCEPLAGEGHGVRGLRLKHWIGRRERRKGRRGGGEGGGGEENRHNM